LNPVDFIKEKRNYNNIVKARQQQRDIEYFTLSDLQQEISIDYVRQWANRNYAGSGKFLNWVKTVFKADNFLSFYKYLRHPLPSAKLINDDVKPQLRRVFHADDSIFKHTIRGRDEVCHDLKSESFDKELFDAILFDHNSVVVEDISIENNRYREIISINNIESIECDRESIIKIAYSSTLELENGQEVNGFTYIDTEQYIFFDKDYKIIRQSYHDLRECPADWISSENMFNKNHVVKKSVFSYILPDLEEYVFLKTLQKMTEPNGAIPITTKLKTNDKPAAGSIKKSLTDKEPAMSPMSLDMKGGNLVNPIATSDSQLQAGTIVSIPVELDNNNSLNMDVIKNYFQFHYLPVEALNYLNDRLSEIENKIKSSLIGDYKEQNEAAKNELQVMKGKDGKSDNLRWLSDELSRIKKLSDYKTLALLHGKENVSVEVSFGTDFFLDSIDDLYLSFKGAPNAIERRKILKRISQTKSKHNMEQANRDKILYSLLPYPSDYDFTAAMQRPEQVNDLVFGLQTRFDFWISMFEAEYGQIELFYDGLGEDLKESTKIILITNLIKNIIKNEQSISTENSSEA
jgi:hypothetical protein